MIFIHLRREGATVNEERRREAMELHSRYRSGESRSSGYDSKWGKFTLNVFPGR